MTVAALILAAGAGSRLGGRNKAALFLDAVVATARAAGIADLVVVAGPPHGDETDALARRAGARVVWNPAPERGMASSIAAGLDALAADAALVWPVDHAFVAAPTVAAIVAAATRSLIVIPVHAGRGGHPTAFGADLWPELRACATARDVIAADPTRVLRLPTSDPAVLRDVDLPKDLP